MTWYQSFLPLPITTPEGEARALRYNVQSIWPSTYFDGFYKAPMVSVEDSFYTVYRDYVDFARSQPAILEIGCDTLTTRLGPTNLSIGLRITPTDSAVDGMRTLQLVAVVYEDSAPYPSFSGDTAYARYCARTVIGGAWGVPVSFRFGQEFDTVLTTPLGNWTTARLGAAVFVQDTSNLRVMQSLLIRRFPTGP